MNNNELIKVLEFVNSNKHLLLNNIQQSKTVMNVEFSVYLNFEPMLNNSYLVYKNYKNNFLLNINLTKSTDSNIKLSNPLGNKFVIRYVPLSTDIHIENQDGFIDSIEYNDDEEELFHHSIVLESWQYKGYSFIVDLKRNNIDIEFSFVYEDYNLHGLKFDSFYNLFDELVNK